MIQTSQVFTNIWLECMRQRNKVAIITVESSVLFHKKCRFVDCIFGQAHRKEGERASPAHQGKY